MKITWSWEKSRKLTYLNGEINQMNLKISSQGLYERFLFFKKMTTWWESLERSERVLGKEFLKKWRVYNNDVCKILGYRQKYLSII